MAQATIEVGYGDRDCLECSLSNTITCRRMVRFTRLQKAFAAVGNIRAAAEYEAKQNKLALEVLCCKPGFERV